MDPTKVVELALMLLKVVVDMVGVEKAKALLSNEAVERANVAADALEELKFGVSRN